MNEQEVGGAGGRHIALQPVEGSDFSSACHFHNGFHLKVIGGFGT